MSVTPADVALWARVPAPPVESVDLEVLERVIAAVVERAVTAFAFPDPVEWTAFQDQTVIEVAAETWIAGRNAPQGVAEFGDGPVVRANSIDYALRRRVGAPMGFA